MSNAGMGGPHDGGSEQGAGGVPGGAGQQPGQQPPRSPYGAPHGNPTGAPHGSPYGDSTQGAPQHPQYGSPSPHPQFGAPAQNAPAGGPPQNPGPGAPETPQWAGGPGAPQGPGGPQFPGGPGGPQGPGSSQQPPSKKRPWALLAVALGCVALLVLVVGGGVAYLALNRSGGEDPTAAPTSETESPTELDTGLSTDPAESNFEVISPLDVPPGDADDMREVLANNPLTTGSLPDVTSCELPETPVEQTPEELQAVLDAAGSCLSSVWGTASSDRGLPWQAPSIEVYTYPDIPSSSCEADTFEEDFPRVCNLDSTIYWPTGYGMGASQSDPELVPGAYLWDLAYVSMNPVMWNSSVAFYYGTLMDEIEGDEELSDETWRRNNLQMSCMASAATMQVPSAAQPAPELREAMTDASNWDEDFGSRSMAPESRAQWIKAGFESGGDLAECNTWVAPAEDVA